MKLSQSRADAGLQVTSAMASIRGNTIHSTRSGVFMYSVQTFPCAPRMCVACSGVSTEGTGSKA